MFAALSCQPVRGAAPPQAGHPGLVSARGDDGDFTCLSAFVLLAQGCKNKSAGYVTFHKGNARSQGAATACLQTPGGQGICWPGGKSGFNINQFLDN